jgi:hypothetical protein
MTLEEKQPIDRQMVRQAPDKDQTPMNSNEHMRKHFTDGEYAISDHAIIEARKDGTDPRTVEKLEWVAINGEVIEEYVDRKGFTVTPHRHSIPIHQQRGLCRSLTRNSLVPI